MSALLSQMEVLSAQKVDYYQCSLLPLMFIVHNSLLLV